MHDLSRMIGTNAHVERPLRSVEVEPIEGRCCHDPSSHLTAVRAGYREVDGQPYPPADELALPVNLMACVLIAGRMDAARDATHEGGGCDYDK